MVFGYRVNDAERYGVVTFDADGAVTSIVEKPSQPTSKWAVSGRYLYDEQVVDIARSFRPSPRGELEITELNSRYLDQSQLRVEQLGRGCAWFDAGTHDSLVEASVFEQSLEKRQGLKIGCLEEIAFNQGWISFDQLANETERYGKSSYGHYLAEVLEDHQSIF